MLARMEWQPISTAPKDGDAVLVVEGEPSGDGSMFVGWYDRYSGEWTDGDKFSKAVTHWMPLPDPPIKERHE